MLILQYGVQPQRNTDAVLHTLCEHAACGVTGQILIVPEQFSFDAERALCRAGGSSICLHAEVLSFTRLATRVFAVVGGAAVQTLDKAGRLIAMAGALEQVRSRLKIYGAQIAKPEFLLQLLDMTEEFKSYGADTVALTRVGRELSGSLAEKMEELRLILESYDAVCANARQDPADRLEQLRKALEESDYAADREIFIDGFCDFTAKELQVIAELLQAAKNVTVTLCCDSLTGGQSVFSVPRKTASQLAALAARAQVAVQQVRVEPSKDAGALAYLRRNVFHTHTQPFAGTSAEISLYALQDAREECQAAVAQIRALLLQGARCRDISVACTDMATYQPMLENLCAAYRIPAYFAGTREILRESVMKLVLAALEAASSGMEPETVAEYLKSGLTPISRDACDRLENYAFVWNLRGTLWEKPFTANPDGYGAKPDEITEQKLAALNASRTLAIVPLVELKTALQAAKTTGEQILALYHFLEQSGLQARLEAAVAELTEAGQLQRAQESAQLYGILVHTMEQVYGVLSQTSRTPDEFLRFFRAALTQQTVGTIPAALDCVHIGALPSMRGSESLHRIVLGACEGQLPHASESVGLLSEQERKTLLALGLPMAPDAAGHLERELLYAYQVLTGSTKTLCVTCRATEESYVFARMAALFPSSLRKLPQLLPATVLQAAGALAALPEAAREALSQQLPAVREQTETLLTRAAYTPGTLKKDAVTQLYGKQLRLSASKIDKYCSCRFAYFLNYGLRAKERKRASVDAPLFGTFVHYVLEHTAQQVQKEGGFAAVSEARVLELAQQYMDSFMREQLGGLADKSQREQYLFRRSRFEVREVVSELWRELRQSQFIPEGFELTFCEGGKLPPVTVQGQTASCVINGAVDRVDLFRDGDQTYVRVVDYKTGKKDFDYADILCGIGLQMFIYLFTLEQLGTQAFGTQLTPAGVLYFPARMSVMSSPRRPTEDEACKERRKLLRRKGLLLDDDAVLHAMEPFEEKPQYLPEADNYAAIGQFGQLEHFVHDTLAHMTDRIFEGNLEPNPYQRGSYGACTYCEYKQVCHVNGGGVAMRELAAIKAEEFWKRLEQREAAYG